MADEIYEGGYKYDMDVHKQEQKNSDLQQSNHICCAMPWT